MPLTFQPGAWLKCANKATSFLNCAINLLCHHLCKHCVCKLIYCVNSPTAAQHVALFQRVPYQGNKEERGFQYSLVPPSLSPSLSLPPFFERIPGTNDCTLGAISGVLHCDTNKKAISWVIYYKRSVKLVFHACINWALSVGWLSPEGLIHLPCSCCLTSDSSLTVGLSLVFEVFFIVCSQ